MAKKKQKTQAYPKSVSIPPDIRALENYGVLIANSIRSYYANRPSHLIGSGNRAKKKKGKAPNKKRED